MWKLFKDREEKPFYNTSERLTTIRPLLSLLVLITELAQRRREGSFQKPVRQYVISLIRKDSLKHQPPRKNG